MKNLVNYFNSVRSKIWTEPKVKNSFKKRFVRRTYMGLIRGYYSSLVGRVRYEGDYRPLILGANIDFDMWADSAIVLIGKNDHTKIIDPANEFFPTASHIGTSPHYDHMNPSMAHPTRLRIKNGAKLILEPNTHILVGSYIAIAPGKELTIGAEARISHGVFINTWCGLTIGKNVIIGHQAAIMDYDGHPIFLSKDEENTYGGKSKPIVIEDNVWIGMKATILKGVKIGKGAIIGAHSCVTTDVPPHSIFVGNPAKVIKENISWKRY
jgi:acetyltransferase-like isoleucine patch superfamily enzyme